MSHNSTFTLWIILNEPDQETCIVHFLLQHALPSPLPLPFKVGHGEQLVDFGKESLLLLRQKRIA